MTESLSLGKGDLLVLICAFCFSLHILAIDYFSPKVDGVRMSCIQFLTCGIICAVPALLTESPDIHNILAAWMPILYAGALSSAVGYTLQIVAQKNTDPVIASLLMSLESTFSLLAGWVLLGQKLSSRELLGCLIMFIAIILAQLPDRPKA
jgi:drug/metabolite transporter (DMT)-like permease